MMCVICGKDNKYYVYFRLTYTRHLYDTEFVLSMLRTPKILGTKSNSQVLSLLLRIVVLHSLWLSSDRGRFQRDFILVGFFQ